MKGTWLELEHCELEKLNGGGTNLYKDIMNWIINVFICK